MNKILVLITITFIGIPILIILLGQLGFLKGNPPTDLGITNGRLKAPSRTENSVSSQSQLHLNTEALVDYAKIEPLKFVNNKQHSLTLLKKVISTSFPEATLIVEEPNYLRYEFTTKLMKYTDDVEFYFSDEESCIHFRSASRLGRKDFGKNRSRMELIRTKYLSSN